MNHIYRTVWCKTRNTFVVVSENTASCGKSSSSEKSANRAPLITAALLVLSGNTAFADGGIMTNNNSLDYKGAVVSGESGNSEFFVKNGTTTISNATLTDFSIRGGSGSGGGAGLGGALFVNKGATVILNNVNFISNTATGGEGGVGSLGGAINNLPVDPITTVTGQGGNGYTPEQYSYTDVGGTTGTKGGNGHNMLNTSPTMPSLAGNIGGTGGNGGNGGDGANFSTPLVLGVVGALLDTAAFGADLIATAADPFTAPIVVGKTLEFTSAVLALSDSLAAIDYFNSSIASGQIGLGGTGGTGGNGGNGSDFAGGGLGGKGGKGGNGATTNPSDTLQGLIIAAEVVTLGNITPLTRGFIINPYSGGAAGGDAGNGGNGGIGGFGAGGGAGGDGGNGGAGAGASTSAGVPAIPDKTIEVTTADTYKKGYYDPTNPTNFITIKSGLADPISSYSDTTLVSGQNVTVQTILVPGSTQTMVTQKGSPAIPAGSSEGRANGLDGTGGAGGSGGFGAGAGASGVSPSGIIAGGGGGSGMGGAIFVRAGGNLTITGNALFDNNQVNAGAPQGGVEGSISDGAYGSTAGTDMLMMKDSNVLLNPGQGNTIQFNGSIDDDSASTDNNTSSISSSIPAGQGAGLTVASGLVIFNGSNSYSGQTKIIGGTLQADDGTGINSQSNINFAGGVLQSNGNTVTFSRYLGTAPTGVQWTGSGGFAATGSDLTVSLNNNANLTLGKNYFVDTNSQMLFGSETATNQVNFTNNINLNNSSLTVLATATGSETAQNLAITNGTAVPSNLASIDQTTLSGVLSNGALTINDATHSGTVLLSNANTYAGGTTINGGTLALVNSPTNISNPTLGSLNSNGAVTINNAGIFDISSTGDQAIGTLSGTGSVMLGSKTLTLNQNSDSDFSGSLKDGGINGGTGAGLILAGNGALTLSGDNTYTGTTQINSGTINLTGSLASGTVNVANGSILNNTNGGLATNAILTNAGTINLSADDTVASFINSGTLNGNGQLLHKTTSVLHYSSVNNVNSGALNGNGQTLTATTYALNDGSVINANLGTGVQTDNGTVLLNGTTSVSTVNISTGTTTLGSTGRLNNAPVLNVAGNLRLGGNEKITALNGAGNVDLSLGGLTTDSGDFSGVLKSSNANYGLIKVSTGALKLSGNNTYTGATKINAGTVNLTGSLASGTVNVASGATLNDTNGGLAANANLTNAGTVNLEANNTIGTFTNTGTLNGTGKTLSAGTYSLNDGSVINANLGLGAMITSGVVTLNGIAASNLINVLTGSTLNLGSVLDVGNTTSHLSNPTTALTLNGTINLYDGNEYIQSLQGSGVVNLRNNNLFVSNGGVFSGVIKGATSTVNLTGGALNLNNNNVTTAQSTNVTKGASLVLGATSTLDSETVTVDQGSDLTLNSGSVLKYKLLTGGSLNSPGGVINAATFTNSTGSTVGGFLTFNGNFVNNGTLSPGNSPGLINVLGNLVQNGTYLQQFQTNVPGSGYDQIKVGGTSTLTSNSVLIEQAYGAITPKFGNVYQIIANSTGGAIRSSGAFGNVLFQSNSAATPVNNAAVVFDVNKGQLITTGLNSSTSTFADLGGSNVNQRRGASALLAGATRNVGINQIDSSTQIGQDTVTLLTTSDSLNRFVPTSYSGITDYALLSNKVVSDILFSRPLSASKSRGTKSDNFISDKNAYIGYTHNQYGFAGNSINRNDFYLGTEVGNEMLSVGALFLGSTGSISSTYGRSSVDGYGGTGYVRGTLTPDLTILGSAGYSNYNYDLSRSGLNGSVNAATSSGSLNTDLGLTYMAFNQNGYSIQPRLGLSYGNASVKGFHETGSTQGILGISGYNADRLSGQLGAVFAKDVELFSRPLNVALDVGVNEFFTDHKNNMNTTVLADTSIKFPISSAQNTKVFGFAGLGATYQLSSSTTVYAKYEANTMNSNDSISNNATVEFKTSF